MRGVDTGGRLGGAKRQQRNNFGSPWQVSHRNLRGEVDRKRELHSRSQREVVMQRGYS